MQINGKRSGKAELCVGDVHGMRAESRKARGSQLRWRAEDNEATPKQQQGNNKARLGRRPDREEEDPGTQLS